MWTQYITRRHYVGDDVKLHAEYVRSPFILKLSNFTNNDVPIRGNVFAIMIRSWDFFSRACACQWHTPTECFQVSSNEFHYLKAQFDTNHAHGEKVSPFALNSSTLTQNIAYFTNHYEGVFTIPNELPSWFPLIGLKCTQLTFVAHFSGFALVFFFGYALFECHTHKKFTLIKVQLDRTES